jgi:predicted nucleic acid-binding protein
MSVLLDSDISIEILCAQDQDILAQWTRLVASGQAILTSPIVAAELWAGARPKERHVLEAYFSLLVTIPIDYTIGQLAGDFMQRYAAGRGLEIPDALIAASAVQHQAALWTRNRKHYPMPQLKFHT